MLSQRRHRGVAASALWCVRARCEGDPAEKEEEEEEEEEEEVDEEEEEKDEEDEGAPSQAAFNARSRM